MTDAQVQYLLDRIAIDDAINAYSHALDQREWKLIEEAFTPDAEIVLIDRSTTYTPKSLVEALSANDATRLSGQHLVGKTRTTITGENADAVTEAFWTTLQKTEDTEKFLLIRGTGIYKDTLIKQEGGWRISRRELALKTITRDLVNLAEADLENIRYTLAESWLD